MDRSAITLRRHAAKDSLKNLLGDPLRLFRAGIVLFHLRVQLSDSAFTHKLEPATGLEPASPFGLVVRSDRGVHLPTRGRNTSKMVPSEGFEPTTWPFVGLGS